jgi:hypothetical protein
MAATTQTGATLPGGPDLAGLSYVPLTLPASYRPITRTEGAVAYAANVTSNPLRIDQSGLLTGLLLTFTGTLTTGVTVPLLTNAAPYSIIKYLTLMVSGGAGRSINVPGYALNMVERTREQDYSDSAVTPTTASFANVWTFDLHLPVCVRDGNLYGSWSDYLGAIFTGDPEVSVQLSVTWASEATIISNQGAALAVLAGNLSVTSFKLDVPTPDRDMNLLTAISWTHQLVDEQVIAIGGAGALGTLPSLPVYEPRVYLRIWDLILNNGAYANGVVASYDAVIQDYIDFDQALSEQIFLARQRRRYVTPLPAGSYVMDFAAGNTRMFWLPVQHITLFKWTPTISGVGLVNASLERVSESVIPSPLARKWVAVAAASRS